MSYCYKCGAKANDQDSYCNSCGVLLSGSEGVSYKNEHIHKRSNKTLIVSIVLILLFGYIILDVWAASQLKPDFSIDSIISGISDFEAKVGSTSTSASTNIRIKNPTFVPVIAGRIVYDAGYGSTKIAEGKTGLVIVAPYSTQDLRADVRVSYVQAGVAGFKALKNLIVGGNDKLNANVYADLGLGKIQIARYG